MKSLPPCIFRDGDTFDPRLLEYTFENMQRELAALERVRYAHAMVPLPFGPLASGAAAERGKLFMKPSAAFGAWEIEALELSAAAVDGTEVVLSATDGTSTVSVTVTTTGASAFVHGSAFDLLQVTAGDEVTFAVTGNGATAVDVSAVAHIRSDRLKGQPPSNFSRVSLLDGDTWTAATIAGLFDAFRTDVDAHNTLDNALRVNMFPFRMNSATLDTDRDELVLPALGRELDTVSCYCYDAPATALPNVAIEDSGGGFPAGTGVTGSPAAWASSHQTAGFAPATQADDDPTDDTDDWTATLLLAGSGVIDSMINVVIWGA